MVESQFHRAGRFARLDRCDDLVVLACCLRNAIAIGLIVRCIERLTHAGVVDQKAPEARHQVGIAGHVANDFVEAVVADRGFGRDTVGNRTAELPLGLFERSNLAGLGILCCQTGDRGIDHRRGLEEVAHRAEIHRRHAGAAIGLDSDIAFTGQLLQDFP